MAELMIGARELEALRAYADGVRPDMTATELAAARRKLQAAGLVHPTPMFVGLTRNGFAFLADQEVSRG